MMMVLHLRVASCDLRHCDPFTFIAYDRDDKIVNFREKMRAIRLIIRYFYMIAMISTCLTPSWSFLNRLFLEPDISSESIPPLCPLVKSEGSREPSHIKERDDFWNAFNLKQFNRNQIKTWILFLYFSFWCHHWKATVSSLMLEGNKWERD